MKLLLCEDDRASRRLLESVLGGWGFSVTSTQDGNSAWQVIQGEDPPRLMLLDRVLPDLDGLELCRRIRVEPLLSSAYIIMLTSLSESSDIVAGLHAGANDYVVKPFDRDVLHARLQVGVRMIELECAAALRLQQLEQALEQVKRLEGLLPICFHCKCIRTDHDPWKTIEQYISEHSDARFTHGLCPACLEAHYPE